MIRLDKEMKNQIFGGLFIFLVALAPDRPSMAAAIEIKLSKIHGLLVFAEAVIGEPMQSTALRDYFERNAMNSKEVRAILERFKKVHASVNWGISLPDFPLMRNQVS